MFKNRNSPDETAPAPEAFRNALAKLVQIGLSVARIVGQLAEAETALAEAASKTSAAEGVSALVDSLDEAIKVDRATAAAAEARQAAAARTDSVAGAFARVSRAVRLTMLLAERLDRGWARQGVADDRLAMAGRQVARGVEDAIERNADGEHAERLTEALADRLESLDVETELSDRPAEEIILEICRDLGLDPKRMAVRPLVWDTARPVEIRTAAPLAGPMADAEPIFRAQTLNDHVPLIGDERDVASYTRLEPDRRARRPPLSKVHGSDDSAAAPWPGYRKPPSSTSVAVC